MHSSFGKDYHPSLDTLLMIQNLFFVGMIGAMLVSPEKYQFGGLNASTSYYGTEFLLTRAINRPVLYRAGVTLWYLLVLILPLITVLHALNDPDLVVEEYATTVQQSCLTQVPGSTLLPSETKKHSTELISIPRGNVLVAEWQFWMFLLTAIATQVLLVLLHPIKYGKFIFWAFFFAMIFLPLIFIFDTIGKGTPSLYEALFFSFTSHQLLCWILTASALVLTQLGCERRFVTFEH
jgi:hypothetical protein